MRKRNIRRAFCQECTFLVPLETDFKLRQVLYGRWSGSESEFKVCRVLELQFWTKFCCSSDVSYIPRDFWGNFQKPWKRSKRLRHYYSANNGRSCKRKKALFSKKYINLKTVFVTQIWIFKPNIKMFPSSSENGKKAPSARDLNIAAMEVLLCSTIFLSGNKAKFMNHSWSISVIKTLQHDLLFSKSTCAEISFSRDGSKIKIEWFITEKRPKSSKNRVFWPFQKYLSETEIDSEISFVKLVLELVRFRIRAIRSKLTRHLEEKIGQTLILRRKPIPTTLPFQRVHRYSIEKPSWNPRKIP